MILFKIHIKFSNICQKLVLTVDSALLCSENVWFCSKNARFCSKIFSRFMLEIARWSLEILLCSKCSTIFALEIAGIQNSKSKIVREIARIENFNDRNARDRYFCRSVSTLISNTSSVFTMHTAPVTFTIWKTEKSRNFYTVISLLGDVAESGSALINLVAIGGGFRLWTVRCRTSCGWSR